MATLELSYAVEFAQQISRQDGLTSDLLGFPFQMKARVHGQPGVGKRHPLFPATSEPHLEKVALASGKNLESRSTNLPPELADPAFGGVSVPDEKLQFVGSQAYGIDIPVLWPPLKSTLREPLLHQPKSLAIIHQ